MRGAEELGHLARCLDIGIDTGQDAKMRLLAIYWQVVAGKAATPDNYHRLKTRFTSRGRFRHEKSGYADSRESGSQETEEHDESDRMQNGSHPKGGTIAKGRNDEAEQLCKNQSARAACRPHHSHHRRRFPTRGKISRKGGDVGRPRLAEERDHTGHGNGSGGTLHAAHKRATRRQ